jgi:hypothetical protein
MHPIDQAGVAEAPRLFDDRLAALYKGPLCFMDCAFLDSGEPGSKTLIIIEVSVEYEPDARIAGPYSYGRSHF